MHLLPRITIVAAFLVSTALSVTAQDTEVLAEPAPDLWTVPITRDWLEQHLATGRAKPSRDAHALARSQVWATGVDRSAMQAFATSASGSTVGAKVSPFADYDYLKFGTEVTGDPGTSAAQPSSKVSWEANWSRSVADLGVNLGFGTAGAVGNAQTGYTQSLNGSLGVPVLRQSGLRATEMRFTPNMNIDTATGALASSLNSELVTQKVLSSRADRLESVLNMKVGYAVAADARPSATAKLEWRLTPNF
jgi:hypothetical protein